MGTLFNFAKRYPMTGLTLLVAAITAAAVVVVLAATPAAAQNFGCGQNAYTGQIICGRVEPTCEQQPRPGCPNWGNYNQGWGYQRQQVCWWERDFWGQPVQRCRLQ